MNHRCGNPQFKGDMTCLCQWGPYVWSRPYAIEWWSEVFAPGMRLLGPEDFK